MNSLTEIPILSIVTYIPLVGALAIVFLIPKEKTATIRAFGRAFEHRPRRSTHCVSCSCGASGRPGPNGSIVRGIRGSSTPTGPVDARTAGSFGSRTMR